LRVIHKELHWAGFLIPHFYVGVFREGDEIRFELER